MTKKIRTGSTIRGCLAVLMLALALALLASCGGGGGGDVTDTVLPIDQTPTDTTTPTTPAIAGFDFTLSTGDYWEYGWDYSYSYFAVGASSSMSTASHFRITLGDPIVVGGVPFYEILLSGTAQYSDSVDVTPKGAYLGISGNELITLAADGTTQKVIFDAMTGSWPGSGYFTVFPSTTLFEGTLSTINNDYLSGAAYQVKESSSTSQCEYYPGVGTICGGDYDLNIDSREYYQAGVGPVGLYYHFSIGDSSWSSSETTNLGLTASSLRGDVVDYQLEVEPNNLVAQATSITLPAKIKGDSVNEVQWGGTTAVPLTVGIMIRTEAEPNDSVYAPQILTVPTRLTGDVLNGVDSSATVNVQAVPGGTTYPATFEDWYKLTLLTPNTVTFNLDFSGFESDLDMYLFTFDGLSVLTTQANSVNDNITTKNYTEQISKYLSAGTYYLAVDGYNTPVRTDYVLDVLAGTVSYLNVSDWYRFTVATPTQVSVTVTGGPEFVVTDASGNSTLASGGEAGASLNLAAGTYLVGVGGSGSYTLQITAP